VAPEDRAKSVEAKVVENAGQKEQKEKIKN
jgi:hypothetical protein